MESTLHLRCNVVSKEDPYVSVALHLFRYASVDNICCCVSETDLVSSIKENFIA